MLRAFRSYKYNIIRECSATRARVVCELHVYVVYPRDQADNSQSKGACELLKIYTHRIGDELACEMSEECIELMRKVLEKYEKREREIEERLEECKKRREELRSKDDTEPAISITLSTEDLSDRREKARARNKQLLQDLKKVRAMLRTESIYSPNEEELRELAATYRSSLEK